jgi:hypothetical protein
MARGRTPRGEDGDEQGGDEGKALHTHGIARSVGINCSEGEPVLTALDTVK